jgi:hypothetical protein
MDMLSRNLGLGILAASLIAVVLVLATPKPVEASIHEIIAALCRSGGEEVVPFGQNKSGGSFLRALQASGFITSIVETPTLVTLNFNPDVPNSKFVSLGFDLTIPDGWAPGVDLTLSPLIAPDPSFPAHSHCNNLR